MTFTSGIIVNVLAGMAVSVLLSASLSVIRVLLGRFRLTTTLSVRGATIEVDVNRLGDLKRSLLALMDEPQVFIAYSFKDNDQARKLAQELRKRGIRVWLAEEQIRPGDNIGNRIEDALLTSGYLLALLSESSLSSIAVQNEFQMALLRESRGKWPRVIPVLIEPVEVPPQLQGKLYVDLTGDYEAGLERIALAVGDGHAKAANVAEGDPGPTRASRLE